MDILESQLNAGAKQSKRQKNPLDAYTPSAYLNLSQGIGLYVLD